MSGDWRRRGGALAFVGVVVGAAACSTSPTCEPLTVRESQNRRVASSVVCTYLTARNAKTGTPWFYGGCADLCGAPAVRCHVDCAFQSAFSAILLGGGDDGGAHSCPGSDVAVICQQTTGTLSCPASEGSSSTFPYQDSCESAER